MSENSKIVTFAELVERGVLEIGDGYRAKLDELGGNGPIFLRAGLLTHQGLIWEPAERFHAHLAAKVKSKLGLPGDTIVTTKGNSVGRAGYVPRHAPDFVYSPHLSYWRSLRHNELDPMFLRYWVQGEEFLSQLAAMASSTDMAPYLSLRDQARLRVTLPDICSQKSVVAVLGALDEKIAVNDRTGRTSLLLADVLFRAEVANSCYGMATFGSMAQVFGGGTPSTSESKYWDGNIAWTTPSDVTALSSPYLFGTSRTITQAGLDSCASRLYPPGSILMTSRATIGAFAVSEIPAAVNQGFIVVVPPNARLRWWLFHEMRSRVDDMVGIANGSTFLELSRRNFKAMPVRLCADERMQVFADTVGPLHDSAARTAQQSRTLAVLRDTLLPQLMSGEIRVQDAKKVVEDVT